MLASTLIGIGAYSVLLAVVTAVEIVTPVERYSIASRLRGFVFWALTLALGPIGVLAIQTLWSKMGISPVLTLSLSSTGTILGVVAAVVFRDFLAYWNHRFQHRFLWSIHALHHAQTELHAAHGYAHFLEKGFRFLLFALPLSLIQFKFPGTPFAIMLMLELLERYIHSSTTLHMGPLRLIFVDNRFHRIHHSVQQEHFDKNFGILLSFWDRLFGTAYEPAPNEWPATGLEGVNPPGSVFEYIAFPILLPRHYIRQRPRTIRPV
jgi:sterol desaturase/sphingolipid hydroxylase (fatty acid hydroxylase superfamily)